MPKYLPTKIGLYLIEGCLQSLKPRQPVWLQISRKHDCILGLGGGKAYKTVFQVVCRSKNIAIKMSSNLKKKYFRK